MRCEEVGFCEGTRLGARFGVHLVGPFFPLGVSLCGGCLLIRVRGYALTRCFFGPFFRLGVFCSDGLVCISRE